LSSGITSASCGIDTFDLTEMADDFTDSVACDFFGSAAGDFSGCVAEGELAALGGLEGFWMSSTLTSFKLLYGD